MGNDFWLLFVMNMAMFIVGSVVGWHWKAMQDTHKKEVEKNG